MAVAGRIDAAEIDAIALFDGPGEMRERCRTFDWASTSLGPTTDWPPSLRTTAQMVLGAGLPMVVHWGPQAIAIYNDARAPIIGPRHPAALGRSAFEQFPERREFLEEMFARVRTGESVTLADTWFTVVRDDGPAEACFTVSFSPVRDERGEVEGMLAVVIETTTRVRAEAAFRAGQARLQLALDVAELGTWEIDLATGAAKLDARGAEIVGLQPGDAGDAARAQAERVHPDDLAGLQADVAAGITAGVAFDLAYRVVLTDGRVRHVASRARALTNDVGRPLRLVGTNRDVTAERVAAAEHARLLEAERAARRDAEAANRSKSEFLAVMSHELRTPLNAIGGYAELIELGIHGPVTEAQRTSLARIQQSQRHLLGLINQVLNYTRIDAGAVRYDMMDVPVAEALATAEALVLPQVRSRGLAYVPAAVPADLTVRADVEKLQQILLNLVGNAIKFTDRGEVRVACRVAGGAVSIAVSDTGIGIAPEKLAGIFEPFVQIDQRLTRANDGVGLGLAISRELARGMGGDLTAASVPGQGSVFTLQLPTAPKPERR
jgi:PAS domain S-box-containing protein